MRWAGTACIEAGPCNEKSGQEGTDAEMVMSGPLLSVKENECHVMMPYAVR